MSEKKRIRNLSTRWLLPFKGLVLTVYTVLCTGIVVTMLDGSGNVIDWVFGVLMAFGYIYFFFRLMRVTTKLHRVEFDEEFLYVLHRKQDMIIPLENIESVEISTLGGVYKVNLFHPEQLGGHFYFKLSLFYPLNASSKDALVNVLRKNIVTARSKRTEIVRNALHS